MVRTFMRRLMLLLCGLLLVAQAQALTPAQARAIAAGDTDERIAALNAAASAGEPGLAPFVQALLDDAVKLTPAQVLLIDGTAVKDAATGQAASLPETAEDVVNNNRMRGALQAALAALKLFSPEIAARREAVGELIKQTLDASSLPLLDKALVSETDPALKDKLGLMRAALVIASPDKDKRLEAARQLSEASDPAVKSLLIEKIASEPDAEVKSAMSQALSRLESRLAWGERLGLAFTGISLGSILLLVALGLAITYGLMGVINMAHGELMMIGAYATFAVQGVFRQYLPAAFDWYLVAALPLAFAASALVGAVLERGVLRFLYGRPLETLLATWGISLVLMQLVRTLFGAQNVGVENPAWMSGGVQLLPNLTLPYNRLVIIGFALAVLLGMGWIIARTRLGLWVRGATQNRPIAACMGVNPARIDTLAFALRP